MGIRPEAYNEAESAADAVVMKREREREKISFSDGAFSGGSLGFEGAVS